MHHLNKYLSIITAALVGGLLVFAFYGVYIQIDAHFQLKELEARKEAWIKRENRSYMYIIHKGCMLTDKYRVVHVGDFVKWEALKGSLEDGKGKQILDIFDYTKQAMLEADEFKIIYSQEGYPKSVSVDWDTATYDDECFVKISEFREI